MTTLLAWLFWMGMAVVFYTYVGYGLLLFLLVRLRGRRQASGAPAGAELPPVTLIVPAYNEEATILEKLRNTIELDYPADCLTVYFVTDGSTDATGAQLQNSAIPTTLQMCVLHRPERLGKLAAVDRVMPLVTTPITVFTDANAMLNRTALRHLVKHYADPAVGAVAGEKRVRKSDDAGAQGTGEGAYWRYESLLKRLDAQLYTVVGAAGELFSIRTALYETVPRDTIIEDFYLSLKIAMRGHRVAYAPDAYAVEGHSASTREELKRKIRISAGGLQAIARLPGLLNPLRYRVLSFQYISHRVLRWTLAPLLLPVLLLANVALAITGGPIYWLVGAAQVAFYMMALIGFIMEQLGVKVKLVYIPYYFCLMNYAVYAGAMRLLRGGQSAIWEKAQRA